MRLTTWNVNGIRNPFSYPPWNTARTFPAMFDILGSDIVVMQELKIQRKDLRDDMVLIDGWDCYFSLPKHKKGYSGVGIYTRNATCAPIRAEEGLLGVLPSPSGVPYCELPEDQSIGGYPNALQVAELGVDAAALDAEGRCLVLEFRAFVLFGVYSPANSNGLRDDFRYGFINALDCRIRNLVRKGKRVVLVGDLNVSRDESDTASAADDCRKNGISHEEYISTPNRRVFNQLLVGGEVFGERDEGREQGVLWDTTRGFHPQRHGMYTHWEQKINARPGNYGSRIDFVLVSESMQPWIQDANIQEGLLGSDHCPVFANFHDRVQVDGIEAHFLDVMNPFGTFENGERKREWKVGNVPAFSAKRMPEFDKRRSIKSMFSAPAMKKAQSVNQETAVEADGLPKPGKPPADEGRMDINADSVKPDIARADSSGIPASPSPLKRKTSAAQPEKSIKRQKSEPQTTKPGPASNQQSLKGFFKMQDKHSNGTFSTVGIKEKDDAVDEELAGVENGDPTASEMSPTTASTAAANINGSQTATETATPTKAPPETAPPALQSDTDDLSPSRISSQIAATAETQRSWSTLFSKPAAPLCEGHDEPCKTMQTKKKGSNQGRSFWMCARPLGPSGNKERGTEWRCPTFIWCSDWGGKKA